MIHHCLRGGLVIGLLFHERVIGCPCGGQCLIVGDERFLRIRQGGIGCLGGFDQALAFQRNFADGVILRDDGGCRRRVLLRRLQLLRSALQRWSARRSCRRFA